MGCGRFERRALIFCALLLATSCRSPTLQSSHAEVRLGTDILSFGLRYATEEVVLELEVENRGRAEERISWELPVAPFELLEPPSSLPVGASTLQVAFRPVAEGPYEAVVKILDGRGVEATLRLEGSARAVPACPKLGPCHLSTFDLALGRCVKSRLADGTACDPHNPCIRNASCSQGECLGTSVECGDGNACTIDLCDPVEGCQHLPSPPCPGDGKCQLGVCDPTVGCVLRPAPDGHVCGSRRGCDLADICLDAKCVERDPPDGFVCAPASPCQAEGRCQGSTCQRAPAVPMGSTWSFDSLASTAERLEYHDFVLEPSGALSMGGFFEVPRIRANTAMARSAETPARRCIFWNSRLVCADYPYRGSGKVSAIVPSTGETAWTFDFPVARPDYAALAAPGHVFMARLVAMASDRLAAVFEAYPAGTPSGEVTNCRRYFLAVLDASGGLVSAHQIEDPLLDVCNHPHPFGVVADVAGNLTIAFSGTQGNAPLVPTSPTLILHYTRDGLQLWSKLENDLLGGELAQADGLLFPEQGKSALLAATGESVAPSLSSGAFGRAVVTRQRILAAPVVGGTSMQAFDAATKQPAWTYSRPNQVMASTQLRLAWQREAELAWPQTIGVFFAVREGVPVVVAVDAQTGREEWACPTSVALRTGPQLFEIANGAMAIMENAKTCGTCDPPFAGSQAAFHVFSAPQLSIPLEPWIGAFGGSGHDHREEQLFSPPKSSSTFSGTR